MDRERQGDLLFLALAFVTQMLPGPDDGISLFIQELLDAHDVFHVATPIHTLPGAALDRLELWKFRLPESQNIGRQTAQACNFANPEIKFLRNQDLTRLGGFSVDLFPGTHAACEKRRPLCRKARIPVTAVSSTMRDSEQPQFVLQERSQLSELRRHVLAVRRISSHD